MAGGAGWRWPWSSRQQPPGEGLAAAASDPAVDPVVDASDAPTAAARSSSIPPLRADDYQPQRPLQLQLQFDYRIDPAAPSRHDLSLRWFWIDPAGDDLVLAGHCQRSGSFGLFHSRWIHACTEAARAGAMEPFEEGIEEVTEPIPIPALAPLLLERFAASRHGRLELLQQRHGDELTVLLYLACADGLLQQREKQLVAQHLALRAADLGLVVEELAQQLRWLPLPAEEEFRVAVTRLDHLDPDQVQQLIAIAEQVIDVKISRDGQEQPGIDHLRAVLLG